MNFWSVGKLSESRRNDTNSTVLEQWIFLRAHEHFMQGPTDHVVPSKYWLKSSSWHVTADNEMETDKKKYAAIFSGRLLV